MKYDSQITELKNLLPTAKSILIALPAGADMDKMAAALGLFLILESQGKEVSVVCDDDIKVSAGHLFGVDHIQKTLPKTDGGNLTLTLEGVAASDNTIPALEKLDWFAENNNLNLVFHVLPGQTFQPAKIVPHYQGSGFNLIFTIGAVNLNALGNLYQQNGIFTGAHIVNVDNQSTNTSFGQTNVLDTVASSLSEIMTNLITDLGYMLDADSASNLLAGIFDVTGNLTNTKATPDTFMAVAQCLRAGGKKPGSANRQSTPMIQPQDQPKPSFDWSALMPASTAVGQGGPSSQPTASAQSVDTSYTVPPVVPSQPQNYIDAGDHSSPATLDVSSANLFDAIQPPSSENIPSPEERPAGEGVVSETVEPEWLTPKIFKGSSIG